jgi:hypothetical protein
MTDLPLQSSLSSVHRRSSILDKIKLRNQTCSSNAARGVSSLRMISPFGAVQVHPRTVEVPRLPGWPHHAQALGNTRQRVVCHRNGRKQTRSRRVWSASGVRRGCIRHVCHVFSILTTTAIRSDHSHSSYSIALCLLHVCIT